MRSLKLFLIMMVAITALAGQSSALGGELMLMDEDSGTYYWWGITFLVLTGGAVSWSQSSQAKSEEALVNAQSSYALYQGAASAIDAETYRLEAQGYLREAQVEETRANMGRFLGVVFALTTYFSFFPDHAPDTSIFVTQNGLNIRYRF